MPPTAPVNYARSGNPTWNAFEEALGGLEGGRALVHASGMGAISAALSLVPAGGTVVAPDTTYNGTGDLLAAHEEAGGTVVRVHATDTAGFLAALESADLLWLESPTNPLMDVTELDVVLARVARARGDERRRQHALDAAALPAALARRRRRRALGDEVPLRTQRRRARRDRRGRHRAGAARSASACVATAPCTGRSPGRWRSSSPSAGCARSRCGSSGRAPPRPSWPGASRATRPWRGCATPGSGAILSIDVAGDAEAAERVCAATRLWLHSTSLGGVESQVERRRRHPSESEQVPVNLLRLSVGIEHVDDLWADLDQALDAA